MRKQEIMMRLIEHEMLLDDLDERITLIESQLKKKVSKKNVKVSK